MVVDSALTSKYLHGTVVVGIVCKDNMANSNTEKKIYSRFDKGVDQIAITCKKMIPNQNSKGFWNSEQKSQAPIWASFACIVALNKLLEVITNEDI